MKLFPFFKKEKWAHLMTKEMTGITFAAGAPHEKSNISVFVHFYESDKGNRRIESACSYAEVPKSKIDEYVKSTHYYQKTVLRWLNGRFDPEIPKYSEIGSDDTANALRGKVQ